MEIQKRTGWYFWCFLTDEGRKLLDEIVKAKGKQKLPSPPWQTNIKRLLEGRKKREIKKKVIVIVQGDTGNHFD